MCRTLGNPLQQMMLKKVSLFSEAQLTRPLLHHRYIDFCHVLFHNIFIVQFNTQRLPSALRERSPRAVGERICWKHWGREPFNFPIHKTQGSLLTRCNAVTES
jgi:hypothetical protein